MTDPTELVLTGVFAVASAVFACAALWRRGRLAVQAELPHAMPLAGWDGEPQAVAVPPPLPSGKVGVGFYRPWDLLGVAMIFLIFALMVLGSTHGAKEGAKALGAGALLINMAFQVILTGAVAASVVGRVGWVSWLGLRWAGWPRVLVIAPGAVFFMWLLFIALNLSGYVHWMESFGVETVQDTVKVLQQSEDPLVLGLMAVAAVIAAPLCEEIVFRGYFYPVLKQHAGPWPAALCASLVFAAAHGNLTALLPLFVFGALLVLVYEKTGSLWAPIAVHCCFNSATVLVQLAARHFHIPLDSP